MWSPQNSQQFVDAYSFVHVLHGVIFFWLFRLAFRSASTPMLLVAVTACAVGWELIENSPFLIERYREATISASYAGDSVLNSISDVGFCVLGSCWRRGCRGMPRWWESWRPRSHSR
ncbi:MAG: DUF2585 family protein [Chloroflexi bacterium]|nr:MAG: DUF2585 family protein [Chloroflexota bacterium]